MGKRILILDVVSYLLTDSGFEVQTLLTGEQVKDMINKFHPHLVLMDVMLADMDGRVIRSKSLAVERRITSGLNGTISERLADYGILYDVWF